MVCAYLIPSFLQTQVVCRLYVSLVPLQSNVREHGQLHPLAGVQNNEKAKSRSNSTKEVRKPRPEEQ